MTKEFDFRGALLDLPEIAYLLNEGCKSNNDMTKLAFLKTVMEIKGVDSGLSDRIEICFPGVSPKTEEEFANSVDGLMDKESRERVDELLESFVDRSPLETIEDQIKDYDPLDVDLEAMFNKGSGYDSNDINDITSII
jgi:hypothetical protein